MKRYRILGFDFDTRPSLLLMEIQDNWDEATKNSWRDMQSKIKQRITNDFGLTCGEDKIKNFVDIGNSPFSVISFHNKFLRQARHAFIIGSYYPALTACCALGERILNHLIINLRDSFKSTPEYKKIYRKKSFDNWEIALDALESWKALSPKTIDLFRELRHLRNDALHFNPEVDDENNDRRFALQAIKKLTDIIEEQFSIFKPKELYISNLDGSPSIIKKECENIPFVKMVILPQCYYVGPFHTLEHSANGGWMVCDDYKYENREITDEEFTHLWNSKKNNQGEASDDKSN